VGTTRIISLPKGGLIHLDYYSSAAAADYGGRWLHCTVIRSSRPRQPVQLGSMFLFYFFLISYCWVRVFFYVAAACYCYVNHYRFEDAFDVKKKLDRLHINHIPAGL